jgi:hypothetical protein
VPRVYVEALRDRSIDIRLQRRCRIWCSGARRISLDCGHVPQLAMPEILTAHLCETLDSMDF